ncbi:MAG: phosphoenolpyruvate--protein phosphotransferase [Deltaproteobacteria bacterium]|nr:phosphoenolpyruvate--protein phosphotransferase [Candidatus Zymogenaceae bacterium]
MAKERVHKQIRLKGIGVSPGIAMGTAEVYRNELEDITVYPVEKEAVADEIRRYVEALESVESHLRESAEIVTEKIGTTEAGIFDAQIALLSGTLFRKTVPAAVKRDLINVEAVLQNSLRDFLNAPPGPQGEEIKKRQQDIKDIHRQIIHLLVKKNPQCIILYDTVILTAREFLPSDMTLFPPGQVLGLIAEMGGMNSHTAIMARSSAIPAVMGVEKASSFITNGDFLIIDGSTGDVVVNPDSDDQEIYNEKIARARAIRDRMESLIDLESETTDRRAVTLMANISRFEDVGQARRNGAVGIGLFRTEIPFLMGEHFIAEEEQYQLYRKVITGMEAYPVTIRTLDLGGDKVLTQDLFNREANPFLGLRSIRFSLRYPEIFTTQLRAILRASAFGRVKLLFPMVTTLDELATITEIYRQVREEVGRQGVKPLVEPLLGVMIEVPSSALMAESFLDRVDFASIGTNDLIQYTLAVDRGNRLVSELYSPYNPAVLKLIDMTVKAGKSTGKEVSVCGEMASDPVSAILLLGMGINILSMEPRYLLRIKEVVISISKDAAARAARKALSMNTAREVEEFIIERFALPRETASSE